MSGKIAEETVARLLAVGWKGDLWADHYRSRVRLMGEFLRRSAWWADQVDATDQWPFFDIADHVAPGVRVPDALAARLERRIDEGIGWPVVAQCCRASLHWAAVLDAGAAPRFTEDPFEPLLLFFERGGGFTIETGFVDVGAGAVRLRTWRDHLTPEPVVDLSATALDAVDAET
jgi:hypothetical protein